MKQKIIIGTLCLTLAVALLLSLAACHKPQTDQPSQPDPAAASSEVDVSTPEPKTVADTDMEDAVVVMASADIGLMGVKEEKQPLSGDALISYFQLDLV